MTQSPKPRPIWLRLILFFAIGIALRIASIIFVEAMSAAGVDPISILFLNLIGVICFYACLNLHVNYRIRDAFMILIPIFNIAYSVKIIWRVTSLPYIAWDPSQNPSAPTQGLTKAQRAEAYQHGIDAGLPAPVADLAANALFPIEDLYPPSRAFTEAVQAPAAAFREKVGELVNYNEIGREAIAALQNYIRLARLHGDHYYTQRLQHIIDTNMPRRVAPAAPGLHAPK